MIVEHIVKVQRPVYSSDPNMPWLVYDQLRSREVQIKDKDIPTHVKKAMGNDLKAFFKARWDTEKDTWNILGKTNWRSW